MLAKCCGTCGISIDDWEHGYHHCLLVEKRIRTDITCDYEFYHEQSIVNEFEMKDCWEKPTSYGKGSNCFNCLHHNCKDKKEDKKYFCGCWQQGKVKNT